MTINVPDGVWRWFLELELDKSATKTALVVAGIAALRVLSDFERDQMIHWAKLIQKRGSSWADFERACALSEKARAAALGRANKRVLEQKVAGSKRGRRSKSAAGKIGFDWPPEARTPGV